MEEAVVELEAEEGKDLSTQRKSPCKQIGASKAFEFEAQIFHAFYTKIVPLIECQI